MGPSPGDAEKSEVSPDTRFVSQLQKLLMLHHFSFIFPKKVHWCAHLQNPTGLKYFLSPKYSKNEVHFQHLRLIIWSKMPRILKGMGQGVTAKDT